MSSPLILGLGNPLLDISAHVQQDLLNKYGLKSNDAILAEEKHLPLYDELEKSYAPVAYVAGGATQNTIRVAQWMLQRPHATAYVGAVGKNCRRAKVLREAAEKDGVQTLYYEVEGAITGTCAVLVNDKHRSLVANLAAANLLDAKHIESPSVKQAIESARIFYSAGFFLTHTAGPIVSKMVAQHASSNGKIYALNLSAPFIVNFFHNQLMELIPYADFIFSNETEARAFGDKMGWTVSDKDEKTNLKIIALNLSQMPHVTSRPRIVVFTQGPEETIVANGAHGGSVHTYAVNKLDQSLIVDTNGAGDAFVGGFLAGLALNEPIALCVEAGHAASRLIIQETGCTLPHSLPPRVFTSTRAQQLPRVVTISTPTFSKYALTEPVTGIVEPIIATFTVVKGFGRGGKQLGIPTANVPSEIVQKIAPTQIGIYFGWAKLRGKTYKTVASIGYNPFFKNESKTIEPYLIDYSGSDFYDEKMSILLCGYIRPEKNYNGLQELKEAILTDVETARLALDLPEWRRFEADCPLPIV
jgi:adenosine kinase